MALYAQRESFQPLQEEKGIERRHGCARIAQELGPDSSNKGCCSDIMCITDIMIARVWINKLRKLARSFPVKTTTIHNHTSDASSVTTDKLGRRMHRDVHSMRKDIDQIRCSKGIVGNQRNFIGMNKLGQSIKVRNIYQRIAQAFNQNQLGIVLNGCFYFSQIFNINKSRGNAIARQGFLEQIKGATVDGRGCYYMVASMRQG